VEYNYQDVKLVQKLEQKLGLMELAMALAYNAKVNLGDVFSQVRTWDQIIYHHLRAKNIVIPRKINAGKKDGQIIGAYVKEPITGRHDWVVSFDLNSLYPHLIMQYNISPDTKLRADMSGEPPFPFRNSMSPAEVMAGAKDKDLAEYKKRNFSVAGNGICFRKDKLGFMPELMERFYAERKHYKKLMIEAQKKKQQNPDDESLDFEIAKYHNFQLVRKIQLNSAYGAMGNQYFRYFDIDIAEAITTSGQLSIQYIANKLNDFLNKTLNTGDYDYVVASDTDSVYLRLGNLVRATAKNKTKNEIVRFLDKSCKEVIEPFINKCYDELAQKMNAYSNKMVMEREVIADVGVWTAKKRYMLNVHNSEGVQYEEPKMKIMGIETTRSSTPMIVRQKLKDAIKLVLTGTEEQVIDFVANFKREFKNYSPDQIAFPRGCNNINTYIDESTIYRKSTPIAVKGALIYNHCDIILSDRLIEEMYAERYNTTTTSRKDIGDIYVDGVPINIKSNNIEKENFSPNMMSGVKLFEYLSDEKNRLQFLFVNYKETENGVDILSERLVDVEHISWECLKVQCQGNGVIQFRKGELKLNENQTRGEFLNGFSDAYADYIKREEIKLQKLRNIFLND
jgi:hypothetical protein